MRIAKCMLKCLCMPGWWGVSERLRENMRIAKCVLKCLCMPGVEQAFFHTSSPRVV